MILFPRSGSNQVGQSYRAGKATLLPDTTAQERYEKLGKVFTRLKKNFNRDNLDDFIQTANSSRE